MQRLATLYSRAIQGLEAVSVSVETHISNGLPSLSIVGLPETAVKESKDRVRSAIINSGYEFPLRRITINLAPADLPKEGGRFDLPIALGILIASQQVLVTAPENYEIAGELALSGDLRPFKGALPFAIGTRRNKRDLIIPHANAFEAAMPQDNIVYAAQNLREVCNHLANIKLLPRFKFCTVAPTIMQNSCLDLQDIQGQPQAKRALEIAAAGRHSMLLIGPPGTGKTMLASRLPSILPELTIEEALDVAAIRSLSQSNFNSANWRLRPFRAPHHTASAVAMVGGGSIPRPGEITLAHHGVLFLDELPEYERRVIEVLREPMETGCIAISRASKKIVFPAKFQLIAAMNPCPCGQSGNSQQNCHCSAEQIRRYQAKISTPLLDRIDLHIEVPPINANMLMEQAPHHSSECSAAVKARVQQAVARQLQRSLKPNSLLSNEEIKAVCKLDKEATAIIKKAVTTLNLSARSFYKVLKVARTIADLNNSTNIQIKHLQESLSFRSKINLKL